jgi:hypothetical protein
MGRSKCRSGLSSCKGGFCKCFTTEVADATAAAADAAAAPHWPEDHEVPLPHTLLPKPDVEGCLMMETYGRPGHMLEIVADANKINMLTNWHGDYEESGEQGWYMHNCFPGRVHRLKIAVRFKPVNRGEEVIGEFVWNWMCSEWTSTNLLVPVTLFRDSSAERRLRKSLAHARRVTSTRSTSRELAEWVIV